MTPTAPTVSILTATMGRGDWIGSLTSALTQDHPNTEVILVVDDPTLQCGQLDRLADRYSELRIIRNGANVGLTRSMNIAARAASGEYFVRHDDDDFSHADRVSKLIGLMERDGLDLAGSAAEARNEGETAAWIQSPPTDDADIKLALENGNCLIHPTIAIRRTAFEKLGGYDETFRFAQDYALYLHAKRLGMTFGCLPEPLVDRIYGPSSITVDRRKTQMLYSLAAKLLHTAETGNLKRVPAILGKFMVIFATPMKLRTWRRHMLARRA